MRSLPRPLDKRQWTRIAIAVGVILAVALVNLFVVIWEYNGIVTLPRIAEMPMATQLRFSMDTMPANASAPGGAYVCQSSCFTWNPSVVYFSGRHLVAVRESTRSHCGGIQIVQTAGYLLFREAWSSVLVGTMGEIQPGSTTVDVQARVPNLVMDGDGKEHFGFEDPRWLVHGDDLYLLTAREMNSNPAMFLVPVNSIAPEVTFGQPVALKSVNGEGSPQKNWMYVPYKQPGDDRLLFVSQLDPLQIVASDPRTGACQLVEEQPHSGRTYWGQRLSGSSVFITSDHILMAADESAVFFGLAHSRAVHKTFGDMLRSYVMYFARLSRLRDGGWRLLTSDKFTVPVDGSDSSMRINYPTTISESPQHPDKYLISVGEMDCSSHLITIERQGVVDAINKLTPGLMPEGGPTARRHQ